MSNNAFDKASQTIKSFDSYLGDINHEPPKCHIWNVLSGLSNVQLIDVYLNITEIPLQAFRNSIL